MIPKISFCLFFLACLEAQVTSTTVLGTVTDRTGAMVPNAMVVITNTGTGQTRSTASNSEGQYRVEFLPIGTYDLEISAQGFKKFGQNGIVLEVNRVARVDAALDVGSASESIEVNSDAPLVNTDNATIGRTVENVEITNLPIVNRNVYTLLTLTPGVQSSSNGIVVGYPEQGGP